MTMSDNDNDRKAAEELLSSSSDTRRHQTEPEQTTPKQTEATDTGPSLKGAIRETYDELDAGDRPSNLTIRDEDLTALFVGLEKSDQLDDVATDAFGALDRDVDGVNRANVLKALVRVGLDTVAEDATETAVDAKREHLASQADDF